MIASPPIDIFDKGCCTLWKSTIVGHFVSSKLPFLVVKYIANRIWGSLGLLEVLSSDNGFFIFSFDLVEHASAILDYAPCYMANRHVVLRRWTPIIRLCLVALVLLKGHN